MNKILAIVTAFLLVGCADSGSDGGSGGTAGTARTSSGLFLTASLSSNSISADTIRNECYNPATGAITAIEPGISSATGTFTINLSASALTVGIADGVVFNDYTVSFSPQSGTAAPGLASRSYTSSFAILSSESTASTSVILADLGSTIPEFLSHNPGGTVYSYQITVSYSGTTFSGENVTLVGTTFPGTWKF